MSFVELDIDLNNIVYGKREVKPVVRYVDSEYYEIMTRNIPSEELYAALEDEQLEGVIIEDKDVEYVQEYVDDMEFLDDVDDMEILDDVEDTGFLDDVEDTGY